MQHTQRPSEITAILTTFRSEHSAEVSDQLEIYIANLEARQSTKVQPAVTGKNPPVWSHQRTIEREHRRALRALQKRNNYQ